LAIFPTSNKIYYKKPYIFWVLFGNKSMICYFFYCFQEKMRYQFEQNGSYFSHPEPSVNANEVQNGQHTADIDMLEQKDDMPHESGEATTVDNSVPGDIPPERSTEDSTKVNGVSHLEQSVNTDKVQDRQQIVDTDIPEQDDKPTESREATTVDNHVAGDIPPERSMEDGNVVDGSAGVADGSPAP
jgi:hypothetical protein